VAWPTPYKMTSTVHIGGPQGSRVILPIIPKQDDEASRPTPQYLPPETPKNPVRSHKNEPPDDRITRHANGTVEMASSRSYTEDYGWGTRTETNSVLYSVNDGHPEAASAVSEIHEEWDLKDRKIGWHTYFDFRS